MDYMTGMVMLANEMTRRARQVGRDHVRGDDCAVPATRAEAMTELSGSKGAGVASRCANRIGRLAHLAGSLFSYGG